jgi:nickel-dependent lactate racemase
MEIKYGSGVIEIDFPKDRTVRVLRPFQDNHLQKTDTLDWFRLHAEEKLAGFLETHRPKTVSIIAEDRTRSNPEYPVMIREIIALLKSAGCGTIRLVIAYGTHPEHRDEDNILIYGKENLAAMEIVGHRSDDKSGLTELGRISDDNILYVNKIAAESDAVIALGSITPHAFAGFTGGRKAVLPGIAGYESISVNHSKVRMPGVGMGVLDGNPIHEEMCRAADLFEAGRPFFMINLVRDCGGHTAGMFAGEWRDVFRNGVDLARSIHEAPFHVPADVVFVGTGGYPRDESFYHATRSVAAASIAVRTGGTIVLIGEFARGIGNREYEKWLSRPRGEVLSLPRERIVPGVHSAYLMAGYLSRAEVILMPGMDRHIAEQCGLKMMDNIGNIDQYLIRKYGKDYVSYVIPDGSETLPVME